MYVLPEWVLWTYRYILLCFSHKLCFQEGDWHTENVDLKKVGPYAQIDCSSIIIPVQTSKGGLGISIAGGTDNPHANDGNPGIFITKLIQGTPAEMDGRLQ